VDVEAPGAALRELSCLALQHGWSLVCAWSAAEAARYLETFKHYERAPHDLIMDGTADEVAVQPMHALQVIRAVNKTDVATLASTFGSVARVSSSSIEALASCPGIGPKKAAQIHELFHQRWS
jgi:DNA excision repair protein ERCC-1